MAEPPRTMTVAELAEVTGQHPSTVTRHCQRGMVPGAVKPGHDWVIPLEGAEKYAASYRPYQALKEPRKGAASE